MLEVLWVILSVISILLGIVVGVPIMSFLLAVVLYFLFLLGYAIFIFIFGVCCIPITLCQKLLSHKSNNSKVGE